MNNIPTPDALVFNENTDSSDNWNLFKIQWSNYITLAEACSSRGTNLTSKKVQLALFLTVIGGKAVKLITKLCNEPKSVDEIISRLDQYFEESKNVTFKRFLFNSAMQESHETCKQFINRLHELSSKCDFDSLANLSKNEIEERLICDRLVAGLSNIRLQKRLLAKTDLSLDKASQMCIADEQAESLAKKMKSSLSEESHDYENELNFKVQGKAYKLCKFCGGKHERGAKYCPAYGKVCNFCSKKNHFSNVCMQKKGNIKKVESNSDGEEPVHSENEDDVYELKNDIPKRRLFVNLPISMKGNRKILKCQLDSGATCNVIGYDELKELVGKPNLLTSHTRLTFYGGSSQISLGKIALHILWGNKRRRMIFEVIKTSHSPLLGAQDCLKLGLISLDENVFLMKNAQDPKGLLTTYPDIGKGLGCFQGSYEFKLDKSIHPVVVPPRRYPLALKEEIRQEIQRLEEIGVIEKVTEPTDWVSAMVVVKKPNKLRICIDPHQLNKAMKRSHYQTTTIEEITPQLKNAKIFSKLDLKDGF